MYIHELVRHIFPGTAPLAVERVMQGGSTWVYRVHRCGETFYLRILPEADASFAPEVFAHQRLHARGVHVPEVVYFEHRNALVGHSIMVTTEMAGTAVGYNQDRSSRRRVLVEAGAELAISTSVPVDGFGWVQRRSERVDRLQGEYASCAAWLQQDTEPAIAALQHASIVRKKDAQALHDALRHATTLFADQPAHLAHGDFDPTHIFHDHGTYTGIIDWGEIRGTPRWYDVGHFAIENTDLLPHLLDGYCSTTSITAHDWQQINMWSLLIAVRRSGRRWRKYPGQVYKPDVEAIQHGLQTLDYM
jgi:aminoglycoside phosphotransferase (APT) family kinase protein